MNLKWLAALLALAAGYDPKLTNERANVAVIAIGASTGGTEVLMELFPKLPGNMPPIVVVQHMPGQFTQILADRLNAKCPIAVKEGEDGDIILPGCAYVAPGGLQTEVVRRGGQVVLRCFEKAHKLGLAPSVDVLFHSVAEAYGDAAIGVILTGMGSDGAQGLLHMKEQGAFTIGQDENSCIVYGMPKAAFECGAVQVQASPSDIPGLLLQKVFRQ